MKKILIIGQHGQVSTYLQRGFAALSASSKIEIQVASRDQLDLAKPQELAAQLAQFDVDLIINPAAYTAVDLAEEERDLAFAVNRDSVSELANFAAAKGLPFIHFSTDYVFAGDANKPYKEKDVTGPTGVYGESKLAGEEAILASDAQALILRTAWVYSNHGKNFYKTMLALAENRTEISVVADQIGAPTYAGSIAQCVIELAQQILSQGGLDESQRGIYHFTCTGQTSWHGFAEQIFALNNITQMKVKPISTAEFPTPARRPAYSVLNTQKLTDTFSVSLPDWQQALALCVAETSEN